MDHQDRDIMQHSDTAASNALVTIIIVDARASGQANAIHKCAGHIRHHNDTEVDIIGIGIDKYLSPGTEPPLHIAQDINEAVQRCHTPWVMLCDSSTRLVDHALDRLVATATERGANAVIAGLDEPNESIFTLQGKLFATSALQDIDLSDCDVWDDGYITLQHIMAKARNVAGIYVDKAEGFAPSPTNPNVAKSGSAKLKGFSRNAISFNLKSEGTANSYTSTLDNAVRQWINKEVDANADSVFSYTSAEDVRLCIDMLNASSEYVAENDRKHHSMSAALNQYLLFIEDWESKKT